MRPTPLQLDTVEALGAGEVPSPVREVLDDIWQRAYLGEKLRAVEVVDDLARFLGPALDVKASSAGGPFPLMFIAPHWRLFVHPSRGTAKVIMGAEFLASQGARESRVEIERIGEWLWRGKGQWKLSRLDLACDVVGLDVARCADLSTCVTRSVGAAVIYDDGEEEAMAPHRPSVHATRREVETVTFGSAKSRVQCCIYDKRKEVTTSGKAWVLDAAREHGWSEGEALARVEFRLRGRGLDEFPEAKLWRLDALDRASEWMGPVWTLLARDAVRYVVPDERDSNRSRWPMALWWWSIMQQGNANPATRKRFVAESARAERIRRAARDVVRGAVALAAETPGAALAASTMLTSIICDEEARTPERALLDVVAVQWGDLIGRQATRADERADVARALREMLAERARWVAWCDDPSRALYASSEKPRTRKAA